MEAIIDAMSVEECIEQLMVMVRPSNTTIMRKLFTVRQGQKESILAFVTRFRGATLESGVEESKLKEAFVDALLYHWQMQARLLLAATLRMSSNQLIQMLFEIAGPRKTEGFVIEIGRQKIGGESIDIEVARVQEHGKIPMLASFGSMRELLGALDGATPHKNFLHNSLQNKVQRNQAGNKGRMG